MLFKIAMYLGLRSPRLVWDSFYYLTISQNLWLTGMITVDGVTIHRKYLPGLSLLISIFNLFIPNLEQAAGIAILCASIAIILVLVKVAERLGFKYPAIPAFLYGLHHLSIIHSSLVMSEIPFSLLALLSLFAFINQGYARGILLAGCASIFRYEGFCLFPAAALAIFLTKRDGKAVAMLPILAAVLLDCTIFAALFGHLSLFSNGGTGLDYFHEARIPDLLHITEVIFSFFFLGPVFVIFSFAGGAVLLKENSRALAPSLTFIGLYFAFHLWWWFVDVRFFLSILPILCLYAGRGIEFVYLRLSKFPGAVLRSSIFVFMTTFMLGLEQLKIGTSPDLVYKIYNVRYLNFYDGVEAAAAWINKRPECSRAYGNEVTVYAYLLPKCTVRNFEALESDFKNNDLPDDSIIIIDNYHYKNPIIDQALETGFIPFDRPLKLKTLATFIGAPVPNRIQKVTILTLNKTN